MRWDVMTKIVLITGGNKGLGYASAEALKIGLQSLYRFSE